MKYRINIIDDEKDIKVFRQRTKKRKKQCINTLPF